MFGLYIAGVSGALLASLALRRTVTKGGGGAFMMELPKYQMPLLKDVVIGLYQRAVIFLKRAGTIIAFAASSAFPATPAAASRSTTSSKFLPSGITTVTSSSAAPFTRASRICFGVAGAAIS